MVSLIQHQVSHTAALVVRPLFLQTIKWVSVFGMQTILVVEDEPNLLRLVSMMLETKGYRVLAAANGEQALRLFAGNSEIDLLLTDVVAPGMSGPLIADQIAALRPGIRILFMSGYDGTQVVQRYIVEEGYSLIVKPFTLDQLIAKINVVLGDDRKPAEKRAASPSD